MRASMKIKIKNAMETAKFIEVDKKPTSVMIGLRSEQILTIDRIEETRNHYPSSEGKRPKKLFKLFYNQTDYICLLSRDFVSL
jgi:hypothetical protein